MYIYIYTDSVYTYSCIIAVYMTRFSVYTASGVIDIYIIYYARMGDRQGYKSDRGGGGGYNMYRGGMFKKKLKGLGRR